MDNVNPIEDVTSRIQTLDASNIEFTPKTWVDDETTGTTITAEDMNRLEQAIQDLSTSVNTLQDSVSRILDVPNVDITSESDTRDAWPVGVSWRWIGGWGKLADQPAIYGSVMTVRRSGGGDAQQLFLATTGDAWARSASASTGAWGTFKKLS